MLDPEACAKIEQRDSPLVSLDSLRSLRDLIDSQPWLSCSASDRCPPGESSDSGGQDEICTTGPDAPSPGGRLPVGAASDKREGFDDRSLVSVAEDGADDRENGGNER